MTIKELEAFPYDLVARYIGRDVWQLKEPFVYNSTRYGQITIPAEFSSDGASIPKFAEIIVGSSWSGRYAKASLPHDYGYFVQKFKRAEVDYMFLEAMTALDVPFWKRRLMHLAVRVGGFIPWYRHKKKLSDKT